MSTSSRTIRFDAALTALDAAAAQVFATASDAGTTKGKAYEIWVMLALARRCQIEGAEISALDCKDVPVKTFRVRGGPGGMSARSDDAEASPCHLQLAGRHCFELHIGLQHRGRSGAHHEIDLSLLLAKDAIGERARGGGPSKARPYLAIECKALSKLTELSQAVPRTLVGVMTDVDPFWSMARLKLMMGDRFANFSQPNLVCQAVVVTTTKAVHNSRQYLEAYPAAIHENVEPKTEVAALNRLWTHVRKCLGVGRQVATRSS